MSLMSMKIESQDQCAAGVRGETKCETEPHLCTCEAVQIGLSKKVTRF